MMGTCRENEVCNIVHHRHWMPSTVDKVCRCPLTTPSCPVVHTRHGNVMNVNSRTQMKFCAPLRNLRPCRDGEIALRRKTLYQSYGVKNVSIVVDCLCDHRQSYWTFHNRSGEDFNDARHLFTVVQNYNNETLCTARVLWLWATRLRIYLSSLHLSDVASVQIRSGRVRR
uniref:Uncharacterized protein n=1 Tax=Anopheles culicifacies TaxID=139723 RepID=A0A182MGJ6_9DIPT